MPETDTNTTLDDLALILAAGREAGKIAMGYFGRDPEVWLKAGVSPVSEADYAVDAFLKDMLRKARPEYGWLSEETVDTPERLSAVRTFVVDPIDGTRAFLEGSDVWCVSIAVVEAGRPLVGVLDCPAREEVFSAQRGKGSNVGGRVLEFVPDEERPRIAGPKPMIDALPNELRNRIRRHDYVPSLAYRVAMLARGDIDATFVKANSRDWDLAAADLILEEAGGSVVSANGNRLSYAGKNPKHGPLAAGAGSLLDTMVTTIAAMRA